MQLVETMTTTRHDDEIFLIGHRDHESLERLKQLPTVKQVLQRFHHHFSEQTVTRVAVRNASHLTVDEVLSVWSKAAVPTTLKKACHRQIGKVQY